MEYSKTLNKYANRIYVPYQLLKILWVLKADEIDEVACDSSVMLLHISHTSHNTLSISFGYRSGLFKLFLSETPTKSTTTGSSVKGFIPAK